MRGKRDKKPLTEEVMLPEAFIHLGHRRTREFLQLAAFHPNTSLRDAFAFAYLQGVWDGWRVCEKVGPQQEGEAQMGTKNNPGDFDCYANAEPDEPMFILLGRDPNAPALVEHWANIREDEGEDAAKVQEARDCAENMRQWLKRLGKPERSFLGAGEPIVAAQLPTRNFSEQRRQ